MKAGFQVVRLRLGVACSFVMAACAEGAPASVAERPRGEDVRGSDVLDEEQGGMEVVDASTTRRASSGVKAADAGQRAQTGEGGARASDAGERKAKAPKRAPDAGTAMPKDAGPREEDTGTPDAGAPRDSGAASPAAPMSSGSCCSASDAPGCGDPALQACVCALSPRCCSEAWDESCARIVREKNCQTGVRDCVCGSAEGQWQQAYCCEGGWNATCESVSIHKCGATAACPY